MCVCACACVFVVCVHVCACGCMCVCVIVFCSGPFDILRRVAQLDAVCQSEAVNRRQALHPA